MIETRPNINLSDFVRTMKSYITYHIRERYSAYLCKCFWKERTFFTDGYFICSVGNVSEKTLKEYIENQGQEVWFMNKAIKYRLYPTKEQFEFEKTINQVPISNNVIG